MAEKVLNQYGHLIPKVLAGLNLPSHADFDDLASVGRIALIEASSHVRTGVTAESYLRLRVRGAMLDYIRQVTWVPRGTLERRRQIDQAVEVLEGKLGRCPTDGEIAAHLGLTLAQFADWQSRAQVYNVHSANVSSEEGEGDLLTNVPDPSTPDPAAELEKQDLIAGITRGIAQLPKRLQQVLALYYHEELQMQEIARVLDVSEGRVSQMHGQAIRLLKRHMRCSAAQEGLIGPAAAESPGM